MSVNAPRGGYSEELVEGGFAIEVAGDRCCTRASTSPTSHTCSCCVSRGSCPTTPRAGCSACSSTRSALRWRSSAGQGGAFASRRRGGGVGGADRGRVPGTGVRREGDGGLAGRGTRRQRRRAGGGPGLRRRSHPVHRVARLTAGAGRLQVDLRPVHRPVGGEQVREAGGVHTRVEAAEPARVAEAHVPGQVRVHAVGRAVHHVDDPLLTATGPDGGLLGELDEPRAVLGQPAQLAVEGVRHVGPQRRRVAVVLILAPRGHQGRPRV